jgi:peptide/nickel transport system permease protein
MRSFFGRPSLAIGAVLVALVVATALGSLAWTPASPYEIDVAAKLRAPGPGHWLGTDALGRDVVSLLMTGARASITVGILAVAIGLIAGTAVGLWASARTGWVEEGLMRLMDFGFAFPAVLSAVMLSALSGPGMATAVLAIALFNIPVFARVSHASAKLIWGREYVLAARACGRSAFQIVRVHVLPNILPVLIVQATIQFALAILAEAALSYLGLGTQPPQPSWGRMLAEAQPWLFKAPMLALWPGLAIVAFVLGLNLLGDGLRDLLDPRLVRRR